MNSSLFLFLRLQITRPAAHFLLCFFFLSRCGLTKDPATTHLNEKTQLSAIDSASYVLGLLVANEARKNNLKIESDWLFRGFEDGNHGRGGLLPDSILKIISTELGNKFREGYFRTIFISSDENRKKSEAFLAENLKKEGIQVLPGGVQYKVLRAGIGNLPGSDSHVKVHYKGTTQSGNEFANSWKTSATEIWEMKGIIPGLREALKNMREGSYWMVYLPPSQAYGEDGLPGKVKANEVLICELALFEVMKSASIPDTTRPRQPMNPTVIPQPARVLPDSNRKPTILPPDTGTRSVPRPVTNPVVPKTDTLVR